MDEEEEDEEEEDEEKEEDEDEDEEDRDDVDADGEAVAPNDDAVLPREDDAIWQIGHASSRPPHEFSNSIECGSVGLSSRGVFCQTINFSLK
jgi:hypothetical protein